MIFKKTSSTIRLALGATALTLIGSVAQADQVFNDDVIVGFSLCVGNDCVNGESFGFDTLRLKENNLRIHFQDTSTSASFPTADWRIVANDTSNGGDSYLAFEDTNAGRQTFRVFQGAPSNAMVVDAQGDLGLGTATPVVELHVVDGDSPTIRLEQNGSSGFTPQTWDLAGNETNFFLRDVTNGSKLPFRIRPNAPTSSIDVAANGDVGIGTSSPGAALDILRTGATQVLVELEATGGTSTKWNLVMDNDGTPNEGISFTRAGTSERELRISPNGATILPTSTAAEHAGKPNGTVYFDGDSMCVLLAGTFQPMHAAGNQTCS